MKQAYPLDAFRDPARLGQTTPCFESGGYLVTGSLLKPPREPLTTSPNKDGLKILQSLCRGEISGFQR